MNPLFAYRSGLEAGHDKDVVAVERYEGADTVWVVIQVPKSNDGFLLELLPGEATKLAEALLQAEKEQTNV